MAVVRVLRVLSYALGEFGRWKGFGRGGHSLFMGWVVMRCGGAGAGEFGRTPCTPGSFLWGFNLKKKKIKEKVQLAADVFIERGLSGDYLSYVRRFLFSTFGGEGKRK